MFLSYLTLFIALCLSTVAAFYSIAGLTAIFAAAVIPIIIMGSILEIAKIVTTLWLHEYWRQAKLSLKAYLVPAVAVLMLMTSMGIFGFLSKAHLDQSVPVGDVVSQVALFDEKIKNERDTIANARTLLGQLDKAVNDIGSAPDREVNGRTISSAERALTVRRQQARDRAALTKTIEDAQARIVKLQEERAPIASQARKVEAEVGPVKYVAALIYGDNPDATTLEKAVRWVIIMIVVVFDPLAIMMLLAATESIGWVKALRKKKEGEDGDPIPPGVPPGPSLEPDNTGHDARTDMVDQSIPVLAPEPQVSYQVLDDISEPEPESRRVEDIPPVQTIKVVPTQWQNTDAIWEMVKPQPKINPIDTIPTVPKVEEPAPEPKEEYKNGDRPFMSGRRGEEKFQVETESLPETSDKFTWGSDYPINANRGDLFLRTDTVPMALYKYNGNKWIAVDKKLNDRYTFDDQYIDFLIGQISSGQYDPELLTDSERLQIEQRLRKDEQ